MATERNRACTQQQAAIWKYQPHDMDVGRLGRCWFKVAHIQRMDDRCATARPQMCECCNILAVKVKLNLLSSPPTLRLSGSSERPAYPGFMVMKTEKVGRRDSLVPSNSNVLRPADLARCMVRICGGGHASMQATGRQALILVWFLR
jgi:hypothetical protein